MEEFVVRGRSGPVGAGLDVNTAEGGGASSTLSAMPTSCLLLIGHSEPKRWSDSQDENLDKEWKESRWIWILLTLKSIHSLLKLRNEAIEERL